MAILAHPDDELAIAGTLAACAAEGAEVALVCATSGDLGAEEEHTPEHRERLAEERREELRCSCRRLGIRHLQILPYGDSGWRPEHGEPPEGSLARASASEVIGRLVRLIRRYRPQAVITFGPDGLYGHRDHIAIGAYATAAFGAARDETLYTADMQAGLSPWRARRLFFMGISDVQRQMLMGHTGAAAVGQVTHTLDTGPHLRAKIDAAHCHETQKAMWEQLEGLLEMEEYRRIAATECLMLAVDRAPAQPGELPQGTILRHVLVG
ncbi:MAG TPA: PIG-L family deacetylase [Anaerolineae bacterium]|nr:PIG-L family deacetylase [Anaerolineae bacterium]HPL28961.1 PIG-L family deacetylase [Anaerolineae bacterium]